MNRATHCLAIATIALLSGTAAADESAHRVTVHAGEWDRQHTVVTFNLPADAPDYRAVVDEQGHRLPLQIERDGRASFILPELAEGEQASFVLSKKHPADVLATWVEVTEQPLDDRLRISVAGQPAVYYQTEERAFPREDLDPLIKRGGFLHPVISPSGRVVTESYPVEHPHHQGIWTSWTRTRFQSENVDFWNMHQGTGRVDFLELTDTWSGPVHGGFRSRHAFVSLAGDEPATALHETWQVRVYNAGTQGDGYRVFDLEKRQETATDEPLEQVEVHYGGLGVRGRDAWTGEDGTYFLTSEGISDRVEGNETRARWTHVSGEVDGRRTGVAILGHPDNFRAPQPVRLHPNEPFFCFAPSQLGEWAIEPGEPYRGRYRFIVADGEPDAEELERHWRDFAHPPEVSVEVIAD